MTKRYEPTAKISEAGEIAAKSAMRYSPGTPCCRTCFHFEAAGTSMSPNKTIKPDRCTLNAFWFPVEPEGHCAFFDSCEDEELCEDEEAP